MHETVCDLAVIRQDEQTLGIEIQPPDRVEADGEEVRWALLRDIDFNPLSGDFIKSVRNKKRTGLVFT